MWLCWCVAGTKALLLLTRAMLRRFGTWLHSASKRAEQLMLTGMDTC
jgi:hypothetical protein